MLKRSLFVAVLSLALGFSTWGAATVIVPDDEVSRGVPTPTLLEELATFSSRRWESRPASHNLRARRLSGSETGDHASSLPLSPPKAAGQDLLHLLTLQRK